MQKILTETLTSASGSSYFCLPIIHKYLIMPMCIKFILKEFTDGEVTFSSCRLL